MIITGKRNKINCIVPEWTDYDDGIKNSLRRIDDRDKKEEIVFDVYIEKPSSEKKKAAKNIAQNIRNCA